MNFTFTYTVERLLRLCITLAVQKFAPCRQRRASILSYGRPPSSSLLHHNTLISFAQAFVNAAAISTILSALPHHQLHKLFTVAMVAFKVLVAAALVCVVAAHDTPHDSECSFSRLCRRTDVFCSRLCCPGHCDCHRDCVRHAWCACQHSSGDSFIRGSSSSSGHFGHCGRVNGDCSLRPTHQHYLPAATSPS